MRSELLGDSQAMPQTPTQEFTSSSVQLLLQMIHLEHVNIYHEDANDLFLTSHSL